MTEDKRAKLPMWAQAEFRRLEMRVAEADARVADSMKPKDARRKFWPAYGDYDDNEGRELPCSRIHFPEFGITVHASENGVEVHAAERIVVRPRVANLVWLTNEPR